MEREIHYRQLARGELRRVGEVDRTERIDTVYVQRGTLLEEHTGDFSSPPWDPVGDGEHSVAALWEMLDDVAARGATAVGAFAGDRLVGFGSVLPHVRRGTAQLVALYVSDEYRSEGIGGRLSDELEQIAREAGDAAMVVSATASKRTVRFYLGRGFEPMAEPLPELFELEPEDVHMHKAL